MKRHFVGLFLLVFLMLVATTPSRGENPAPPANPTASQQELLKQYGKQFGLTAEEINELAASCWNIPCKSQCKAENSAHKKVCQKLPDADAKNACEAARQFKYNKCVKACGC